MGATKAPEGDGTFPTSLLSHMCTETGEYFFTFPPIMMVLGTKDLEGSLLMPERAGHNTMDVKINGAELVACTEGGIPTHSTWAQQTHPEVPIRDLPKQCWENYLRAQSELW